MRVYYPEYHNLSIYFDALAENFCGEGEKHFLGEICNNFSQKSKNPLEIILQFYIIIITIEIYHKKEPDQIFNTSQLENWK